MANVYVRSDDIDGVICGVFKNTPGSAHACHCVGSCTVYFEEYTGPAYWGDLEVKVIRNAENDYTEEEVI